MIPAREATLALAGVLVAACANAFDKQSFTGGKASILDTVGYYVKLDYPVCQENAALQIEVLQHRDKNEFPLGYEFHLQCEIAAGQETRMVKAVIYWDKIGRYVRFEHFPDKPLTKKENAAFIDEDYERLHQILKNRESVLGSHMLDYLARPGAVDPNVDGMSAATPKTLQQAVVPDAAWTTWVMWQYANGEIVEQLKSITEECCTSEFLNLLLRSEDLYENGFALEVLLRKQAFENQFLDGVLIALERGDNGNVALALQYLDWISDDRTFLYARLIDAFYRMQKGYIPMVVRFLSSEPNLPTEILDQLTGPLDGLSFFQVNSILNLLQEWNYCSVKSIQDVSRLLESDSSRVVDRAREFLSRNGAL